MTFPPLHVITDDAVLADPAFDGRAAAVLEAGGAGLALHIRGPRTPGRMLFERVTAVVARARTSGSLIIVNDRTDVGRAADAHGVQLGARSLTVADARVAWPGAWVGCSVHDVDGAVARERDGTDFLLLGTIWASGSHPGRPGAGPALIRGCAAAVGIPVVAIGGIDATRAAEAAAACASGIAALGAVWHRGRPADNVRALLDAWTGTDVQDGDGQ